ncbi:MAG: hypothetical protein GX594_09585, partial [Pirellulaceae bacterium]|nr:hypothetical protein [Pirellulaceae bacterium]
MPDIIQLRAEVEIQAASDGAKTKRFSMVAYSGGLMSPAGWPNVVIDLGGANVGGDIPILAGHADDLDSIVGQGQATVQNNQLHVAGTIIDATSAGQKVVALARSGISLQASVGFTPDKRENLPAGSKVSVNGRTLTAGNQGLTIIRSGRLREVSLLPIGADPNTQVSIAATAAQSKETKIMPETIIIEPKTDSKKILARWKATKFNQQIVADQTENYLHAALAGEISFTDFEHQMVLAENRDLRLTANYADLPKAPAIHASTRDTQPQVIEASFCKTLGLREIEKHYKPEVLEAADRSGCPGVQELILRAAMANGYDAGRLRIDAGNIREVLRAAFQPGIQASGVSTIDVSSILSNTANKVLLDGFSSVEQTWRLISKIRPVKDFKDSTSHRLTDSLEYEELPPSGEIHHGTLGEETYTNRAKTHAKMLALTREAIINDDLGAFDTIRQRLGRGAALKLNKVFWTAFLDDAAFFTEARGNLLTGVLTDD